MGGGARNAGEPQPSESQPPTRLHPQGHPAALLTRLRIHCSTAGQDFIRNKQANHHRALFTLSPGLSNTGHLPGGQSHVIEQGGAFFFQPNEDKEIHSGALRILQKGGKETPMVLYLSQAGDLALGSPQEFLHTTH